MSAQAVLDRIERQALLDRSVIENLRRQVQQSGGKVTADALVKLLVDKGQLTAFQGKKLLSEIAAPQDDELGLAPDEDEALELIEEPTAPARPTAPQAAAPSKPAPAGPQAPGANKQKWKTSASTKGGSPAAPAKPREAAAAPAGGLVPLDESSGLVPLDESSGLVPLDAASGLVPLSEPAGLTPLGHGLTPLPAHDPLLEAAALEGRPLAPPGQAGQSAYVPKPRRIQWESTLMYAGIGALVVMLIVGVILFVTLTRGSAAEMFQHAEEAYKNEQYQDAIAKYEQFLAAFPDDENASLARVRKGLAQLRSVVKGARDWRTPLATARQVLPAIENEPKFAGARDELAAVLPQIAEGFASQAQGAGENIDRAEEYVKLAEEAMELVDNPSYIPTSLRPSTESRVEKILAVIATVRRDISRERELTAAVESIKASAQAGDTVAAYHTRDALLKAYPGLVDSEALREAVLEVSKKQRELVKVEDAPLEALTQDDHAAPEFQVVLAGRSGETAAGAAGKSAVFCAQGAVYAVDASSGSVRWRRFIGFDPAPPPQLVSQDAGADVLAIDGGSHELLRLEGATGKLRWRIPLGEPLSDPLVTEAGILVTAASGKLFQVDPESGAARHLALPQTASLPPGFDAPRSLAYALADHTNVFALTLDPLECKAVFYLGHKPGTVLVPPVFVRGYLLVAENTGPQASRLIVVATGDDGAKLARLPGSFDLKGRVQTPLLVLGNRVLVLTDLGAMHVFDVDPANKRTPVVQAASLAATQTQPLAMYAAAHQGQLFVGDRRLTKFEIQTSRGELIRRWPMYEGDEFIAPLFAFDDVVVHARRRQGAPGVTLAASAMSDGREIWRTELAAPLAGEAFADTQRRRFVALSASGQLFEIEQASITAGYLDQPSADIGPKARQAPAFASRFELADGKLAFASQPPDARLAYYEPGVREPLRLITPEAPADALACPPVLFQGGLLMACTDGRVYLINPATGSSLAQPFQPPLAPGEVVKWQRAAVLPGGAKFAIADNRRRLYTVELKSSPQPHLAQVASAEVQVEIVSPLAAVGESLFAVVRGRATDSLATFAAADLAPGAETPLKGRVVFGPAEVGPRAFVASDLGGLFCVDEKGASLWNAPLSKGRPAGAPLAEGGDYVLALDDGRVSRLDGQTGRETAATSVGQPLGAAPISFAGRLLLTGSDGTLHVVSLEPPAS
jgi:outer membrane protein assembly factor BamB